MTNHMWDGFWMLSNRRSWGAIPDDLKEIVAKNFNNSAVQQRADIEALNASLQGELEANGMVFNFPDTQPFQQKLVEAGFYKEWKEKYGEEAWGILENGDRADPRLNRANRGREMTQHQVARRGRAGHRHAIGRAGADAPVPRRARRRRRGDALGRSSPPAGSTSPTARRLLMALIRARMVEQDPGTRRYRLGQETSTSSARLPARRHGLLDQAAASLRRLSAATGDTRFVTARHGNYAICPAPRGRRLIRCGRTRCRRGDQQPARGGCRIARDPRRDARGGVRERRSAISRRITQRRPGYSAEIVAEDVERALAAGYALNPGRYVPGSWGIGVPVRLPGRARRRGAVARRVETRMVPARREELARLLQEEARVVEAGIARQFGPVGPA